MTPLRAIHPGIRGLAFILRLSEPAWLIAASCLAFLMRHGTTGMPLEYAGVTILATLAYAVLANTMRCYDGPVLRRLGLNLMWLVGALMATFAVVVVLLFMFKVSNTFSRVWLSTWLGMAVGGIFTLRLIAAWQVRKHVKAGYWRVNVAVLGTGPKAMEVLRALNETDGQQMLLTGFYSITDADVGTDFQRSNLYKGNLDQLLKAGMAGQFDELIVAEVLDNIPNADKLLNSLHRLAINIYYCLPIALFGRVGTYASYGSVPLMLLYRAPLEGPSIWMKRSLDIVASAAFLLLASPILLLAALAVKLSSPGPVFFRQKRGGFNGSDFEMLKFRSMRVGPLPTTDADGKEKQATRNDPRITPVGRFLRKTSLDELPQLINVLRGDMSLVGPRPHVPSHNSYYEQLIDKYASRHKMRPGLTGWAQMNGWRGETETLEKMAKRVEYDIWYVENWSFMLDLKIIFLTPLFLLFQRQAY